MSLQSIFRRAFLMVLASGTQARGYSAKPISRTVPLVDNRPTEALYSTIAQAMASGLRQTATITNPGGTGSTIGVNRLAKSNS